MRHLWHVPRLVDDAHVDSIVGAHAAAVWLDDAWGKN